MRNKFLFSDWTAVSQIDNHIDPNLKASSTAVLNEINGVQEIVGYDLTVYWKERYVTVYKVKVEMDIEGVWSLNTNDAVEFLNTIGFDCEYRLPETIVMTERQRQTLDSLESLGYSYIMRTFKYGHGHVAVVDPNNPVRELYDLSQIKDYNYQDWTFMRIDEPISINTLLGRKDCQ